MKGYVYLIGAQRFGWYKIGKAKNPEVRIRDLGILLPFKIRIFAIYKSDDCGKLESDLHRAYSEYNINGEWFTFPKEKIRSIVFEDLIYLSRIYLDGADVDSSFARFSNLPEDLSKRTGRPLLSPVQCAQYKQLRLLKRQAERDWLVANGLPYTPENRRLAKATIDLSSPSETDAGHPLSPAVENGK